MVALEPVRGSESEPHAQGRPAVCVKRVPSIARRRFVECVLLHSQGRRAQRPLEKISVNLQKAVIASEDGLFLKHNGFDFTAMQKAYKNNERGRKIKGGSTISQQTAKNVFLWQGRSYLRKGLEAYFTVLIELVWGKERIMEVYLNSIEMGDGVYGAQAAAEYWYRKDAENLTPIQAAGIAAILPNPRKFKATSSSSYINKRKSKIVRVMRTVGKINY